MNIIKPSLSLPNLIAGQARAQSGNDKEVVESFKNTLKQMLNNINEDQQNAKETVNMFMNNEIEDVHQVMIAAEKASVGLEMTVEIRNKLLEAYREVMRMSG